MLIIPFKVIRLSCDISLGSFSIKIIVLHLWLFIRNLLLLLYTLIFKGILLFPILFLRRGCIHELGLNVLRPNLHCLHLKILSLSIIQRYLDDNFRLLFSERKGNMLLPRVWWVSSLLLLRAGCFLAIGAEGKTRTDPFGRHLELRTTHFPFNLILFRRGFKVNRLGCWNAAILGDGRFITMTEGMFRLEVMVIVLECDSFWCYFLYFRDFDGFKWNRVLFSWALHILSGKTVPWVIQRFLNFSLDWLWRSDFYPRDWWLLFGCFLGYFSEVRVNLVLGSQPTKIFLFISMQKGRTAFLPLPVLLMGVIQQQRILHLFSLQSLLLDHPMR